MTTTIPAGFDSTDIIDRLRNPLWLPVAREVGDHPGFARRLAEAEAIAVMREAANEIALLRALAGVIERGET